LHILGRVTDTFRLQGRWIGPQELAQIRGLLAEHPDWTRYRLSRHLATLWDWRNPAGQLKDMAARTLLLKLERRGWIALPACRRASPNRMRHKPSPRLAQPVSQEPITESLAALQPLLLNEVSPPSDLARRALFEGLLQTYHYLGHRSPVGENLQYLVEDRSGRALGCVLFGAAAWQCKARDRHIGWDAALREQRLTWVTNNTRLLLLPWIRVPHLASHVLGRVARRLSGDWQRKYGHPVWLLETFVDTSRFRGLCYQAANWRCVGQTTGRTRQNKTMIPQAAPKAVWLYPLRPDWQQVLTAP
jgi:hypothetical protein